MMGAAENISDLRTLLSIVAEETGALKMSDADEDSVGWTTEGQLPMTFGHVRRAHSALAALEAALSAAEPVAARHGFDGHGFQYIDNGSGSDWKTRKPDAEMLYAAPPAPSVAVKALNTIEALVGNVEHKGGGANAAKMYADMLNDIRCVVTSALSAQVQDVAADTVSKKIELWFFRDLTDTQRRCLFTIFGMPIHEITMQMQQRMVLKHILSALPAAPAKQEGGK